MKTYLGEIIFNITGKWRKGKSYMGHSFDCESNLIASKDQKVNKFYFRERTSLNRMLGLRLNNY